jgi:hypothetical protein
MKKELVGIRLVVHLAHAAKIKVHLQLFQQSARHISDG